MRPDADSPRHAKTHRTAAWLLAALLACRMILLVLMPHQDPSEARYAEISRKMAETGNWITPQHLYGVPFWAKPPLSMWMSDRRTDSPLRRTLSRGFYRLLSRGASVDIPADAGDFRLLDRRVVAALRQLPEGGKFMKGLYNWVGFNKTAVSFDVAERFTGASKFNLPKLMELAMTGLTSFSSFPLRMWVGIGSMISAASILYAAYILIHTMIKGADVPGWATLVVAVSFLGGVQLLSIGLLGEYVTRIFNEVKRRPNYLVAERHGFPSPPEQQ